MFPVSLWAKDLVPIWKRELNAFCLSSIITSIRRKSLRRHSWAKVRLIENPWNRVLSIIIYILPRQQYFNVLHGSNWGNLRDWLNPWTEMPSCTHQTLFCLPCSQGINFENTAKQFSHRARQLGKMIWICSMMFDGSFGSRTHKCYDTTTSLDFTACRPSSARWAAVFRGCSGSRGTSQSFG